MTPVSPKIVSAAQSTYIILENAEHRGGDLWRILWPIELVNAGSKKALKDKLFCKVLTRLSLTF